MLAALVVTSLADNMMTDGLITLREAMAAANNDTVADAMVPSQLGSGTDKISFNPALFSGGPATIVLTQGQLVIASSLILEGPGAELLTIDASGNDATPTVNNGDGSRVIDVNDGNDSNYAAVEISGITITGGDVSGNSYAAAAGGGIRNLEHLSLFESVVSNNSTTGEFSTAGGISTYYFGGPSGETQIVRSRISGNASSSGGGVYSGGSTTIKESTIESNVATTNGGGVLKNSGTLNIVDSTISGNTANEGGGLWTRYSTTTITNSTISGNTATSLGGGVLAPLRTASAKLYVNHSTITDNTTVQGKGGGISLKVDGSASGGQASISHTIIAGNHDQSGIAPDVDRTTNPSLVSLIAAFNLIGDNAGSGLIEAQSGDVNGNLIGGSGSASIDPLLSELGNHGGPTQTHRFNVGSPALNAGNPALLPGQGGIPLSDQRGTGYPRILAGIIDIGALETAALLGDYNFDTIAGQSDHTLWTQSYGATTGIGLDADGNGNGIVDSADYVVWRKFVGTYADDHGNTAAQSTYAVPPASLFGNLQAAGDVDWFRFSATAGMNYQFSIELIQLANSRLRLLGIDGTTVLLADLDGGAASLNWTAPADGTYYLEVSSASDVGTYNLLIPLDDHGNSAAFTTLVSIPSTTSGTLHNPADVDWFRFSATAGFTYVFDVTLVGLASSGLRLVGTNGSTVLQQDTNGGAAQIIWTAPQDGTYYLEVHGVSGGSGTYQLTASRDEANTAALAEPVAIFSNTTANIFQTGDVDWFRFELFANGTASVTTVLGTLSGSVLRVFASDSTTLIGSDLNGGAGEVEWAATAGEYFARVSGLGSATGTYTLQVSLDVPDDHGNSAGAATPVVVPSGTSGIIGAPGDEDWFSFTAQAGVDYVFETVLGTLGDSVLWLYDSDGVTELDFNDDNVDLESRIGWTATSNGTFYVAVGGFDSEVGSYSLQVSLGDPDEHGDSSGAATSVVVPSATSGKIGVTGDEDWFSFTAQAGMGYVFETVLGTLGDSVLWLYDSDGVTELDFNDDYVDRESHIEWTATSSGTFYLAVGGFESSGGTYQLLIDVLAGVGGRVDSVSGSENYAAASNDAPTHNMYSSRIPPSWSLRRQENVLGSFMLQNSWRASSVRPWTDDIARTIERTRSDRIEHDTQPVAYLSIVPRKWVIDAAFEIWDRSVDDRQLLNRPASIQ